MGHNGVAGRHEDVGLEVELVTFPGIDDDGRRNGDSKSLSILIIDDDQLAADSARALLEIAGHRVVVAYRGLAGLAEAERVSPDVVLCDIELSDSLDGYGVARALRSNPRLRDTFLVAITGFGQTPYKMRGRAAGFDLFLTKPVNLLALERVLSQRRRQPPLTTG